jgi:ferredoxin
MACVEVCPVDCIVKRSEPDSDWPTQLYIDPEECISCGVCEPECPWEAIYEDEQVPEIFQADIEKNAAILECRDDFIVPEKGETETPSPADVEANKAKWGFTS